MKKRSSLLLILSISLLAVFFFTCEKKQENLIKIGAVLPLTGKVSFLGVGEQNAMTLAIKYSNENLMKNKKLEIIYEDCQGETDLAVTAANKLINVDKCDIIIASTTNVAEGIIPLIEKSEKDIIMLALTISPNITHKSNRIFRIWPNAFQEREILSEYINQKYNQIGVLYVESDYGILAKEIMDKLIGKKIKIAESYPRGSSDFKNILTKFADKDINAISLISYPPEFISIVKQLKELKLNLDIIGDIGFTFDFVINALGELTNGIVFTAPKYTIDLEDNDYSKYFTNSYINKYNSKPSWNESFSHDNIIFIANALKNYFEKQNILDAFQSIKSFEGVNEIINMDNTGDSNSELVLVKLESKKIVNVN